MGISESAETIGPSGLALVTAQLLPRALSVLTSSRFWIGIVVAGASFALVHLVLRSRRFQVSAATLSLPFNLGNITYRTTEQDRVLAWQLYVHLKTRKAALPFDKENDVIIEVYDSLYELFQITRDFLCNIPLRNLRQERNVADLMLRVQNDGLRPHLTKWQAPFRRWWMKAIESPENGDKPPQEIQRQFPSYDVLVSDLRQMNTEMSKFAEELLRIARPERRSLWQRLADKWRSRATVPEAPSPSDRQSFESPALLRPPTTEP